MKPKHFSSTLAIALALAATSLHADEAQTYHIAPQALGKALTGFADRHNFKLMYDSNLAHGLRTQGVNGSLGRDAALRKLLEGSGLDYRYTAPGTVTLVKATQPPGKPTSAPAQKPDRSDATVLPTVTVIGKPEHKDPYNEDYVIPDATVGTKTDTPIMETPLNVQVVSKQVLKDQQVIRLDQALKNVSGVTVTSAGDGTQGGSPNLGRQ